MMSSDFHNFAQVDPQLENRRGLLHWKDEGTKFNKNFSNENMEQRGENERGAKSARNTAI